MSTKNSERKAVFSQPVRALSMEELKKVSGGAFTAPGYKSGGGPDNQGHQF